MKLRGCPCFHELHSLGLHDGTACGSELELPKNPFGIKTEALMQALGLDSMDCLGLQIDLSDESLLYGAFS